MISIDTDVLRMLADSAGAANNELGEAAQILNQITQHNEWGCRERITINEQIQEIRRQIGRVWEASESFTSVLNQVSEEFMAEEAAVSQMFAGVESLLGKILSVPVSSILFPETLPPSVKIWKGTEIDNKTPGKIESAVLEELFREKLRNPIQVVDFDTIQKGIEATAG